VQEKKKVKESPPPLGTERRDTEKGKTERRGKRMDLVSEAAGSRTRRQRGGDKRNGRKGGGNSPESKSPQAKQIKGNFSAEWRGKW